jgi:hypothetical protein
MVNRRSRRTAGGSGSVGLLCGLGALLVAACPPSPVADAPASSLAVRVLVVDTQQNPPDGKAPIVVQFLYNGQVVELASSTNVTCNGIAMSWNGLGYAERVPLVTPGGSYACSHIRAGVTTTVSVTAQPRPGITSPAQGATLSRATPLTVTYAPGGGTGVRAGAGDGSTGLSGNTQPDNGTYTGLNVSTLKAGPGSVDLVRESTPTPSGTGFVSAEAQYSSGFAITVTWM